MYQNTKENVFATTNYLEQQAIFAQHDAMLSAKRAYEKDHELYPIFEKEYNLILTKYSAFVAKLKATNLYAARFREITNLTLGIGDIITNDEQLKAENINNIIVNQLDFNTLYTSNHWSGIINSFVQIHTVIFKKDNRLIADAKTILNRITNNKVYTDFVINLTKELIKVGKDTCITELTQDIKNSNKLLNYNGVLNVYQLDLSGKAPNLVITEHFEDKNEKQNKTTLLDLAQQKSKYSLVVFYQSGCGPCEETIAGLQGYFKDITSKGIKILSFSADTDEQVFKTTSSQFLWKDKYCDFQGTNGINFKNYAVIGTPTLYLIDKKGNIIKKLSGIADLKKAIGLK